MWWFQMFWTCLVPGGFKRPKASWSTLSSSLADKASWGFRSGELRTKTKLTEIFNSRWHLRYEAKEAKEKKKICRELTSAILLRYIQPIFYLAIGTLGRHKRGGGVSSNPKCSYQKGLIFFARGREGSGLTFFQEDFTIKTGNFSPKAKGGRGSLTQSKKVLA